MFSGGSKGNTGKKSFNERLCELYWLNWTLLIDWTLLITSCVYRVFMNLFLQYFGGQAPRGRGSRTEIRAEDRGSRSTNTHSEAVFLRKGVPKMCNKFTVEHPATLLKSHFGMGILWICCIFSDQIFLRTPLECCFWNGIL